MSEYFCCDNKCEKRNECGRHADMENKAFVESSHGVVGVTPCGQACAENNYKFYRPRT